MIGSFSHLRICFFLLMFLPVCESYSQTGSYWVFGDSIALDFRTEPPAFRYSTNNSLAPGSSICDSSGNLLFYWPSQGGSYFSQLYDSNNAVIPYSKGLFHNGLQPVILQSNNNEWLVIGSYTTDNMLIDSTKPNKSGLYVTIVKRDSDTGKLYVDTLNKNKLIYEQYFYDIISLKDDKDGFWILSQTHDTIYSFHVVSSNVSKPIKNVVNDGFATSCYYYNDKGGANAVSTFTPSNSGDFLIKRLIHNDYMHQCLMITYFATFTCSFNKTNGTIGNYKLDSVYNGNSFINSITFSPKDSFIYYTDNNSELFQKNRTTGECIKIVKTTISTNGRDTMVSSVKLAPNNKIYFFVLNNLVEGCISEITYPDKPWPICGYRYNSLNNLMEHSNSYYLPQNLYDHHFSSFEHWQNRCNDTIYFTTNSDSIFTRFEWSVYDTTNKIQASGFGKNFYLTLPFTGKYFVKLKSISNKNQSQWFSDSISYIRYAKASYQMNSFEGCQWVSFYFKDKSFSDSGKNIYNWYWDFGDGTDTNITASVMNKGSVNHRYFKSNTNQVTLVFSDGTCSDTFKTLQPLYIKPAPQPGLSLSPQNGCVPQQFQIKPLHLDTIVSEKYYMYDGSNILKDSFISKPNQPSIPTGFTLTQKDTGLYTIRQELTGTTGCVTQDSVAIQLNTRPYLKLPNDTFICSDEILQLSASVGYKYLWNTGDTTQAIIINKAGTYWVKETNGGCTVGDSINIAQDFDEHCKFNISVYPNPFGNEFKVALYARTAQNLDIQLYEISGKQVASYNNITVNQFATFSVNTSNLASAMYVLHITTNDKKFTYKIVKLVE